MTTQQLTIGLIVAVTWFTAGFMAATIWHLSKKRVQKRYDEEREAKKYWEELAQAVNDAQCISEDRKVTDAWKRINTSDSTDAWKRTNEF